MRSGVDILLEDGRIKDLPKTGQGPAGVARIDCDGRSVVPGLIDCHVHLTLMAVTELAAMTGDVSLDWLDNSAATMAAIIKDGKVVSNKL